MPPLLPRILALLSRRTSGRKLIPEIDGLRTLMAMLDGAGLSQPLQYVNMQS